MLTFNRNLSNWKVVYRKNGGVGKLSMLEWIASRWSCGSCIFFLKWKSGIHNNVYTFSAADLMISCHRKVIAFCGRQPSNLAEHCPIRESLSSEKSWQDYDSRISCWAGLVGQTFYHFFPLSIKVDSRSGSNEVANQISPLKRGIKSWLDHLLSFHDCNWNFAHDAAVMS